MIMSDTIYDFYYSEDHENHLRNLYHMMDMTYRRNFINGTPYTEAVVNGKTPTTKENFKNVHLVFTGTFDTFSKNV